MTDKQHPAPDELVPLTIDEQEQLAQALLDMAASLASDAQQRRSLKRKIKQQHQGN